MRTLFARKRAQGPVGGGLYSYATGDARAPYGVLKVLAVEPGAVHVRTYSNSWTQRPVHVEPSELFMTGFVVHDDGTLGEPSGRLALGHLPISHRSFAAWQPVLLSVQPVTDGELDGYREWRDADGGVWG